MKYTNLVLYIFLQTLLFKSSITALACGVGGSILLKYVGPNDGGTVKLKKNVEIVCALFAFSLLFL